MRDPLLAKFPDLWLLYLAELVASYRDTAPKLADWLEENVPPEFDS